MTDANTGLYYQLPSILRCKGPQGSLLIGLILKQDQGDVTKSSKIFKKYDERYLTHRTNRVHLFLYIDNYKYATLSTLYNKHSQFRCEKVPL